MNSDDRQSQNQLFDCGNYCSTLWLREFKLVLHSRLLQVSSMFPAVKFSSQIEMVRENFVFDPRDYCSILLFKGFERWNFVFQDYNF